MARESLLPRAARLLLRQGGTDLAAALGFFTVMSLLPLVALIIMALIAVGSDEGALRILAEALDYLFPASHELIDDAVGNLLGGSFTIGLIALGGLIIGANGLFAAAYRATNRVFGIDSSTLFQVTVKNVSLVTILVVAFLTSDRINLRDPSLGALQPRHIRPQPADYPSPPAIIFGSLSAILPAIFTAVVFAFVLLPTAPNTRVEWRDAAFGAIVAIVLFEIGKPRLLLVQQPSQLSKPHLRPNHLRRRPDALGIHRQPDFPLWRSPNKSSWRIYDRSRS